VAYLKIIKGETPNKWLELTGDQMLLGRHPSCQIVVDNQAISRYHAQILQSHGSFFLEDLRSRNGTSLNGTEIEGRTELHEKDEFKICDLVFQFYLKRPRNEDSSSSHLEDLSSPTGIPDTSTTGKPRHKAGHPDGPGEYDELPNLSPPENRVSDSSSILSTLNAGRDSELRLSVKPETKLRAILEMTRALGGNLKLEVALQEIWTGCSASSLRRTMGLSCCGSRNGKSWSSKPGKHGPAAVKSPARA